MNDDQYNDLIDRLDRLERMILLTTNYRKLTPDLKKHAAALVGGKGSQPSDREAALQKQFEKLCALSRVTRNSYNFPDELLPTFHPQGREHEHKLDAVPLSVLANRACNLAVFSVGPGEVTSYQNVVDALAKSKTIVVTTLHLAGIKRGSKLKIATTKEVIDRIADEGPWYLGGYAGVGADTTTVEVVKKPVRFDTVDPGDSDEEEEDLPSFKPKFDFSLEDELRESPKPKKSAKRKIAARNFEEEDLPEHNLTEEQQVAVAEIHSKVFGTPEKFTDPHGVFVEPPIFDAAAFREAEEETFEESEAAQGVGRFNPRDEPDETGDIPDLEEDEEDIPRFSKSDWDDFETEGDQPEHHPFEDFTLAGEQEKAAKVQVFVRKK